MSANAIVPYTGSTAPTAASTAEAAMKLAQGVIDKFHVGATPAQIAKSVPAGAAPKDDVRKQVRWLQFRLSPDRVQNLSTADAEKLRVAFTIVNLVKTALLDHDESGYRRHQIDQGIRPAVTFQSAATGGFDDIYQSGMARGAEMREAVATKIAEARERAAHLMQAPEALRNAVSGLSERFKAWRKRG